MHKKKTVRKSSVNKDKELDQAAEQVADKIAASLNLDGLRKKIDKITSGSKKAKSIYTNTDVKKDVDKLTKEEKIVGFFKALVDPKGPDHVALKALSEGRIAACPR